MGCFDREKKGYFGPSELEDGLNHMGLFPQHEELSTFFASVDRDNDRRIRYSEFCALISPSMREYSRAVNARQGKGTRNRDVFCADTKKRFKNLFALFFLHETQLESIRRHIRETV